MKSSRGILGEAGFFFLEHLSHPARSGSEKNPGGNLATSEPPNHSPFQYPTKF